MKLSNFPPGWDEERVRRVLAHYEHQTEEEIEAEIRDYMRSKEKEK